MTPPKVSTRGSAGVTGDAAVNAKGSEPKAPKKESKADAKSEDTSTFDPEYKPWQLIPSLRTGIGWGSNGQVDGHLFDGSFGKIGDFVDKHLSFALLTNVNPHKVQFNIGGRLNYDWQTGNELTFGSNYHHFTLGPVAEVNFRPAWTGVTGENWSPLGYLGLSAGIGVGHGTGTFNDGLLHTQTGLASYFNAYLNVVNISIGKVQIGLDFDYTNTHIKGFGAEGGNWPVAHSLGFRFDVRPSVKKMERVVKEEICVETVTDIEDYRSKIAKLEKEVKSLEDIVDTLRAYLENHSKNPYNQANVRKTLVIGHVAERLVKDQNNNDKIQEAVKAAAKAASFDKAAEDMAKITKTDVAKVKGYFAEAEKAYPADYNKFWALTGIPQISDHARKGHIDPKDCADASAVRRELDKLETALEKRKSGLEQQYKRAVHLAGLSLGDEIIQKHVQGVLAATIVNVDTPSFKTAYPRANNKEVDKMEELSKRGPFTVTIDYASDGTVNKVKVDKELYNVAKTVFTSPDHEIAKIYRLAQWLNGKGRLPGEERALKIIKEEFKDELAATDINEAKFAEYIKTLSLGIFGHTDSDGSEEMNQKLSERRALFTKHMLVAFGVDEKRLKAKGFGEKYPQVPERTGNRIARIIAKGKNRRVEFVPVTLKGPITPSAGKQEGHTDAAEVPKEEGGTKGADHKKKGGSKSPAKPAPKTERPKKSSSKKPPAFEAPDE